MRTYYWKKIAKDNGIGEEEKSQVRKEMLNYKIEYLEIQGKDSLETESLKNNLGNVVLLKNPEIESFSAKEWKEKRFLIKKLEKECSMFFEEENWTDIEDVKQLIEERKKYLIEDFKELGIFELENQD